MKQTICVLLVGAVMTASTMVTATADSDPAVAAAFGHHAGCALLLTRDRHHERFVEHGPQQCRMPQSPCSTFKIPNALIGLQTGVLSGPQHLKTWDGVERERQEINRDHTLASAMEHSVVWYFQELASEIGATRMQDWLNRLDYGNRDISGGIDRFWLGGSLQISPLAQLELLKRLWHGTLPFRPEFQQQVSDMLRQPADLPGTLYGKTGSCQGDAQTGTPGHGWFIGWLDWNDDSGRNPTTTWFVVNIRGNDARGVEARSIALRLLAEQRP